MIAARLKRVILKELEPDDFPIDEMTTADQVPGWDSLNHTKILAAVEAEYGIRFRNLEIIRLRNVGELQALVERKVPGSDTPPVK